MMVSFHLAEYNIARCRAPLDTPLMRGFVEELDTLNALADASPGFIWRFKTAEGNATSVRPYDDPLLIVNLSVWTSPDSLKAYAYRTGHAAAYKKRTDWFQELDGPSFVLWWIPAETLPSIDEGRQRLELLAENGPTDKAFTFKTIFPSQWTKVNV